MNVPRNRAEVADALLYAFCVGAIVVAISVVAANFFIGGRGTYFIVRWL